ncbi:DUF359 domain-containing protein [Metallosphaera tengchongensis]|uniref:GTP-dependent dephospho-CoA kinase n=1 Tax=Metallosphaera tengchongensis TaxID=1532350 RepID=A0A6N0NVD1_9CREN|nr:GTP-dependent dephospho-CoA kinase family protein [Metallosphaera tengchongensis]QKQ99802.1 DUF359 domain-containing protein [Metallosphaera tengchongensis]
MEIRDKYKVDLCLKPSPQVRKELSRPYGILFQNDNKLASYVKSFNRIISVGDVVTSRLLDLGIVPFLAIIDGKTRRTVNMGTNKTELVINNEPGVLRYSVMSKVKEILEGEKSISVFVNGEEDMLVIPVILFGKDGDVIVYGQPNAGAVCLENWEGSRWRVLDILSKFIVETC